MQIFENKSGPEFIAAVGPLGQLHTVFCAFKKLVILEVFFFPMVAGYSPAPLGSRMGWVHYSTSQLVDG